MLETEAGISLHFIYAGLGIAGLPPGLGKAIQVCDCPTLKLLNLAQGECEEEGAEVTVKGIALANIVKVSLGKSLK